MSRTQSREGLAGFVRGGVGAVGRGLGELARSPAFTEPLVSPGEVDLQLDVESRGTRQRERAREQLSCRAEVDSRKRSAPSGRKPLRRPLGECFVTLSQLLRVQNRLLEVVSDELFPLDELGASFIQPVGEAPMQLGPRGLRQRVVGGFAYEEVPEAEGVLAGKERPARAG